LKKTLESLTFEGIKRKVDIETWNRKEHFQFFNKFEEPFHGICVHVDVTNSYSNCKSEGISFFLKYLHLSLQAVNQVEAFKYRIIENEVYIYDQIDASPTIARENGSFGFSYIPYHAEFELFQKQAKDEIKRVQSETGLNPAVSGENVIHYSALPWIDFTGLSHARSFTFQDSCPKISFGKVTDNNGILKMPMSVHAHHGLVFGKDVADYISLFQELLEQ